MQAGTPEAQLWSKVALTLIDDAEADINEQISHTGIGIACARWSRRVYDPVFLELLDLIDGDADKIKKHIYKLGDEAKTKVDLRFSAFLRDVEAKRSAKV